MLASWFAAVNVLCSSFPKDPAWEAVSSASSSWAKAQTSASACVVNAAAHVTRVLAVSSKSSLAHAVMDGNTNLSRLVDVSCRARPSSMRVAEVSGACRRRLHVSSSSSSLSLAGCPASWTASSNSSTASFSSPSLSPSNNAAATSTLQETFVTAFIAASIMPTWAAFADRAAVFVQSCAVALSTSAHGFAASLRGAPRQQERKSLAHVTYTAAFLSRSSMQACASSWLASSTSNK
mmetsp:Transcript_9938/g.30467  ORF Transcript_9938/g.30467 Transcript_9938/m.30467 type:complete len:236 (+) Transcript_9938:735-1442(+)|eukprot:scaffold80948_cov36-Tisochrysis_lutea.AAC.2